jgi:hypothetical protein
MQYVIDFLFGLWLLSIPAISEATFPTSRWIFLIWIQIFSPSYRKMLAIYQQQGMLESSSLKDY